MEARFNVGGVFSELVLEFSAHIFHVVEKAEDDVDPGKVDPHFLGQALDLFDLFDVFFAVEPVFCTDPGWDDEAEFFVLAEGLRVDVAEFGGDADHVDGLFPVSHAVFSRSF